MPGLDLLAEDDGKVGGPFGVRFDGRNDGLGEGGEELGGEGAAVVEIELEGVSLWWDGGGCGLRGSKGKLVACELGRESHGDDCG